MKLEIKDINGVYINPDRFFLREERIDKMINSLGLKNVTRIAFNDVYEDRAMTMNHAHKYALEQSINSTPFILFEDDAESIKSLPNCFNIPEEAKLIYLGGSNYISGQTPLMRIENYNKDFYRVYYMLSFHAVLFPNKESVEFVISLLEKAIKENKFNDVTIALASKDNVYLVPKEGNYFYQDDYTSAVTKFLWEDNLKRFLR